MALLRQFLRSSSLFTSSLRVPPPLPILSRNVSRISSSSNHFIESAPYSSATSTTAKEQFGNSEEKTYQQLGGAQGQQETEREEEVNEDEQRFNEELLQLALTHVSTCGWSTEAIAKAAEQAGMSPAIGSMFKDVDLPLYFISQSNQELEEYLKENKDSVGLNAALKWRLSKIVPYSSNYAEAIALISRPENLQQSVPLLMEIADTIAHYALKDSSADMNWYSKRIGIASIYASTELCLVQDKSEKFSDTWKFLERRCVEFEKMGKGELPFTKVPVGDLMHVGYVTLMNLAGRNASR